jgi:hypothetical protein
MTHAAFSVYPDNEPDMKPSITYQNYMDLIHVPLTDVNGKEAASGFKHWTTWDKKSPLPKQGACK